MYFTKWAVPYATRVRDSWRRMRLAILACLTPCELIAFMKQKVNTCTHFSLDQALELAKTLCTYIVGGINCEVFPEHDELNNRLKKCHQMNK